MKKIQFFDDDQVDGILKERVRGMLEEIESLPATEIVGCDDSQLADYFADKHQAALPVLEDPTVFDEISVPRESRTTQFVAHIPFTGDGSFFRYHGGTCKTVYRDAEIKQSELLIEYVITRNADDELEREVNTTALTRVRFA